ncbi:CC038-like protein [Mya arenaria]|uniref:CC038-like protein n=1 Tax=Mya arenaria TaxID=6604 RepID=A0ABY7DM20_MYAAR|nr:CC038-like protein [Mya arenaria]
MLSETEKNGCKEILSKLPIQELVALAETVTKKQIPVASTIDKGGIIRTILNTWGINIDEGQFKVKLENEPQPAQTSGSRAGHSVSPSSSTSTQTGARPRPSSTSTQTSARSQQSTSNTAFAAQTNCNNIGGAQADLNRHTVSNTSNNRHVTAHSSQISQLQSSGNQVVNPDANVNQVNNTTAAATSRVGLTNNIHQTVVDKSELQVLGETFSKWFYENLNSHNPTLSKPQMDFGPNHFWDDAFFMLCSHSPVTSEERFEGPLLVSQRFLSFAQEEQLLFNPNITSEGVYVKSDPFGMVMILVCGTIHRANDCLGVFQQMFGLVKDPRFENNYKIKKTKLDVRTDKPTAMPKLEANPESQMAALVPV